MFTCPRVLVVYMHTIDSQWLLKLEKKMTHIILAVEKTLFCIDCYNLGSIAVIVYCKVAADVTKYCFRGILKFHVNSKNHLLVKLIRGILFIPPN